ncbi:MAG: hypothetical protein ABSB32_20525 [Thermodesulfobacteriota bacterium]|jgi:gas vesicle protein
MFSWLTEHLGGPMVLIFLGAIIVATGGLWAAIEQSKAQRKHKQKREEIARLNQHTAYTLMVMIFLGAIIGAGGGLWAAIEQSKAQKELNKKNEEIARLNQQIASSVTGGESFCYITFPLSDERNNYSSLIFVTNEGQFPVYDVSLRIVDLDRIDLIDQKRPGTITFEDVWSTNVFTKTVGNLGPSQSQMLGNWTLPKVDKARYNIFIAARNGFVTEFVRLARVEGKWKAAYKVEASHGRKPGILLEKIDPIYPRNKQGNIDW